MRKITTLIALLGAMFFLTGCPTEYANPKLLAQGKDKYGPYPTNYKKIIMNAWRSGGNHPMNNGGFDPDSITFTKPYKAYSRVAGTDRPKVFGYFVRSCAKRPNGKTECYRFIVRKHSIHNHTNKPDDGYYELLGYEPFFKEPWFKQEKNDATVLTMSRH